MARRRTPARSKADPLVSLVRPERESDTVRDYVGACEARAGATGLRTITYRTIRRRIHDDKTVKRRELLKGNDAYRLYNQLHYSPVLVCWFAGTYVSRDPGYDEPKRASIMSLDAFVRHKADGHLIRSQDGITKAFDEFLLWREQIHCEGEDDPRVLPFHTFATKCDTTQLGTQPGDGAFRHAHGTPGRRTDDKTLRWHRAAHGAYHGREVLRVAGRELAPGMHWDVSIGRGEVRVKNSQEAWRVNGASTSYANVFPNARILVPKRSSAKKVWPRQH